MFKNEKRYLQEWIDFHLLNGFEHLYMYDNGSNDNPLEIIQKYVDKGVVTYTKWEVFPPRFSAREHYWKNYYNESYWTAFLDIDEFLFCVDPNVKFIDKIKEYEDFPGIEVNWYCYGDSNNKNYEDKPVIERFTKRAEKNYKINLHVKHISKTNCISDCNNPHFFVYKHNESNVNEKKEKNSGPFSKNVCGEIFRINHYHTKSEEEFFNFKFNKNEENRKTPNREYYIDYNLNSNKEEDKILYRYLEQLKNVDKLY